MWNFLADLRYAVEAIPRMEQQMGATADKLNSMTAQFDKVLDEAANAPQLDAEDLAAIEAHRERLQRLDDMNPDSPVNPEPTEPA